MARLQKKLTSADKSKRKEQASESASASAEVAGEAGSTGSATPASKQDVKPIEKKPRVMPTATVTEPGELNWYRRGIQFFREVRVELKKVTWPNRKQTAGSTLVVIILVFILAAFLGLVDFGLSKLVQVVLA
jgi:preprotein translocase subunit SecE